MNKEKLHSTRIFINDIVTEYKKPVVLCSFGKDSLTLLHIMREMFIELPVILYREPFSPKKYDFADRLIKEWNLSVYDFLPSEVGFFTGNGTAHTINYHEMGGNKKLARMTGLVELTEKDKDYLCTYQDLIKRPLGMNQFPWDVCFHGHKNTDYDPVSGKIPLTVDLLRVPNSADYAYPMRNWTDQDIWDYIEENKVPINEGRYEKVDGKWQDIKDKTLNSDYFTACYKCLDRNNPDTVTCPKTGHAINNIWKQIKYDDLKLDYMGALQGT